MRQGRAVLVFAEPVYWAMSDEEHEAASNLSLGWTAPAVATMGAVGAGAWLAWSFVVDDAYIVLRYASSLARGEGYAFNPGAMTDGVTNLLWLTIATGGLRVGAEPLWFLRFVGSILMVVTCGLVVAAAGRESRPSTGWAVGALLSVQVTLGVWASAGLGTALATALMVGAGGRLLCSALRPSWSGLAAAAMAWARPEAVPAAWLLAVAGAGSSRKNQWTSGLVGLAGVVAVASFRSFLFGSPLPLSAQAKPASLAVGVQYVFFGVLLVSGGAGLWFVAQGVRAARAGVAVAAACAVHLVAVAVAGGDWMPGFRLLAPIVPWYAWLAGLGLAKAWTDAWRGEGSAQPPGKCGCRGLLLACLMVLSLGVPAVDWGLQVSRARTAGVKRQERGVLFARWLQKRYDTLAAVDIGLLGWETGVEIVDFAGVTDPVIGRAPGGHLSKRISAGYLQQRNPDAIVLRLYGPTGVPRAPVERAIARKEWFQSRYRYVATFDYGENWSYAVFERNR